MNNQKIDYTIEKSLKVFCYIVIDNKIPDMTMYNNRGDKTFDVQIWTGLGKKKDFDIYAGKITYPSHIQNQNVTYIMNQDTYEYIRNELGKEVITDVY